MTADWHASPTLRGNRLLLVGLRLADATDFLRPSAVRRKRPR